MAWHAGRFKVGSTLCTLHQTNNIPLSYLTSKFNAYVLTFVCLHFTLSDTGVFNSLDLCITRVAAVNSFVRVVNPPPTGRRAYILSWFYICIGGLLFFWTPTYLFLCYYKRIFDTILLLANFSYKFQRMIYHWSLIDCNSHQLSGTLLSIQTDLNNPVVWMVSVPSPFCYCSNILSKPLESIPNAPFSFSSLARSKSLSVSCLSFIFTLWQNSLDKFSFFLFFFR